MDPFSTELSLLGIFLSLILFNWLDCKLRTVLLFYNYELFCYKLSKVVMLDSFSAYYKCLESPALFSVAVDIQRERIGVRAPSDLGRR